MHATSQLTGSLKEARTCLELFLIVHILAKLHEEHLNQGHKNTEHTGSFYKPSFYPKIFDPVILKSHSIVFSFSLNGSIYLEQKSIIHE